MIKTFRLIITFIVFIKVVVNCSSYDCLPSRSFLLKLKLFQNSYYNSTELDEIKYSIKSIHTPEFEEKVIIGSFKGDGLDKSHSVCLNIASKYEITFSSFLSSNIDTSYALQICDNVFVNQNNGITIEITSDNKCIQIANDKYEKSVKNFENLQTITDIKVVYEMTSTEKFTNLSFNTPTNLILTDNQIEIPKELSNINTSSNESSDYPTFVPSTILNSSPTVSPTTYECSPVYGDTSTSSTSGSYTCSSGMFIKDFYGYTNQQIYSIGIDCSDYYALGPTPHTGGGVSFLTQSSICDCGYNNISVVVGQYVLELSPSSNECSQTSVGSGIGANSFYACSDGKYLVGINWYSGSYLSAIQFICDYPNVENESSNEKYYLTPLYYYTGGSDWTYSGSWLSNKSLRCWYGIALDVDGFVSIIYLENNKLKGNLNEELGNLTHLTQLVLAYNSITGTIPTSYSQFTRMESFVVCTNLLTGNVPDLSGYHSVGELYFYSNSFDGELHLNSSKLFHLSAYYNYFTGPISDFFPDSIDYVDCDTNYFTGTFPHSSLSPTLRLINFAKNVISGALPDLFERVTTVTLPHNVLSGPIPSSFGNMTSLTDFGLEYNYITGTLPLQFPSNIENFDLYGNLLEGTIPSNYSASLYLYDIEFNHITGKLPKFENVDYLLHLELEYNQISGTFFSGFSSKCSLNDFLITSNLFSGIIDSSIGNCINLLYFRFDHNCLSGSIPSSLTKLTKIIQITFGYNLFTGTVSNTLVSSMKKLTYIEMGGNLFTSSLPASLGGLVLIQAIEAQDGYFSGPIPSITSALFIHLLISYNYITGNIPDTISNFMKLLVFSNNQITGNIDFIDKFLSLTDFVAGTNQLTGTIPESISNKTTLQTLYLNSNLLSGSLSLSLCNLDNLRLLNISGLNMCVPSCLTRAAYSVSKTDFIRCQSEQDIALCSLLNHTDIYQQLSSYIDSDTFIYESSHPINFGNTSSYTNYVSINGANSYILTFDDWTNIYDSQRGEEESLIICSDENCQDIIFTFAYDEIPGKDGNSPLFINNTDSFYISLETIIYNHPYDTSNWGYLVTITAIYPLLGWECTSPSNVTQTYSNDTLLQYNLTYDKSYAVNLCGETNWRGISCTFTTVTSLALESYGISGILPSALGLLTGLEILDLKYNSFSGSLPYFIGQLTNLQTLDLSNNELKSPIPNEIGQLTLLQYLYLESNNLYNTIPDELACLNKSLVLMSLAANQLTGKLSSNLCSLGNASIEVTGNDLTCYEECWSNAHQLKAGDIYLCSPTSYPTSTPSFPTFMPTASPKSNIQITVLSYVLGTCLTFILLFGIYLIYFKINSKESKIKRARRNVLSKLPIHKYIINHESLELIIHMVIYASWTISIKDYDGNSVIDLAIQHSLSNDIITEILTQLLCLSNLNTHDNTELNEDFCYAWTKIVQIDSYVESVENVFNMFPSVQKQLSECKDENGRLAVNIASPLCRKAIKESLYFLRRYDFGNTIYPTHVSETSIVYIAIDTLTENTKVALKFLSNNENFINETRGRSELLHNTDGIVQLLETYEAENYPFYEIEIKRRKLENYRYCIVMLAGEKNLGNIIETERLAGKDWLQLQSITIKLAESIDKLHNKGLIHGDLKPLNVMRMGNDIKLIDLDSCARVNIDYYGMKPSQAYLPPEMLFKNDKGILFLKNYTNISDIDSLKLLKAHYSQDSWSFGALLYELFTGMSLFPKDNEDNVDIESFNSLHDFTDEFKIKKLTKITNKLARNLVSLLLDKDPLKRLSMSRVLEHPFVTGKVAPRLIGEEAEYDVFLSYRVESDSIHAQLIYDILTAEGLKVWWDKKSLLSGIDWEDGFSNGLVLSNTFVPIISKNSINHPTNHRCNITLLSENSRCDNVLLEYELALELRERGLTSHIYPILIGDYDSKNDQYIDYFDCGGYPSNVKDCVVRLIDLNVKNHLNRLGLGSRLIEHAGVKSVLNLVMKSQGLVLKGSRNEAFKPIIQDILSMKSMNQNKLNKLIVTENGYNSLN